MKFLSTIFFSLILQCSFGQLTSMGAPHDPTREERITDSINQYCIHRNKLTAIERLNNFPFNKAKEIRLVSFKGLYIGYTLPVKYKEVDLTKIFESTTLGRVQIDSLTDILYNTGYKGKFYSISKGLC